jgi:hypothetical protein
VEGQEGREFLIIWELRVRAGREQGFEQDYGPAGIWAEFFRGGKGYRGTELFRDSRDLAAISR